MSHDATVVKLGNILSNVKDVTNFDSDPASFLAGKAVSVNSSGVLSLLKSDGSRAGVSLGKSLSNTKKTSVCMAGQNVPVRLNLKRARGTVTITNYSNLLTGTADTVTIGETVFTAQSGAVTPGDATFRAASSNDATATSLAAQINAHADASLLVKAVVASAVVTIYALTPGAAGNEIALAYADNGTSTIGATVSGANLAAGSDDIADVDYVVKGANAYIHDTEGVFDFSVINTTVSDAVYVSGVLTGITEDGAEVPAALVDMFGGL